MELVSVKGNIDDITNYANLYQKFSSVGGKSVNVVRRQFMDSELDKYIKGSETLISDVVDVANISVEYVSHGVMLDELDSLVTSVEGVDVVYVGHGVLLDELNEVEELNDESLESTTSHGFMLDEESEEVMDSYFAEIYVSHGILLDELTDDTEIESNIADGTAWEDEDYEETSWGSDEENEVESGSNSSRGVDENSDELSDIDEEEGENPWGEEDDDWNVDEGNFNIEDDGVSGEEENISSKETQGIIEPRFEPQKVLPKSTPVIKVENKKPTPPSMDRSVSPIKNYANVRAYVKENPGCVSADVAKYFSAGEIKKALMSSKIVEKKGKLYAV